MGRRRHPVHRDARRVLLRCLRDPVRLADVPYGRTARHRHDGGGNRCSSVECRATRARDAQHGDDATSRAPEVRHPMPRGIGLRYALPVSIVATLGGCSSPWTDRGTPASLRELQGVWMPGVSVRVANPPRVSPDAIELLEGSACNFTEGFAGFLQKCHGVTRKPSSACTWSMKDGGTGQWV